MPTIIVIILIIVGLQLFSVFFSNKRDVNTYVTLVQGSAYKNNEILQPKEAYKVNPNDILRTTGEDSMLIVTWGDGSVTRLGGDSQLVIYENFVSEDYQDIKINFELEKGKSWSNVTSFMGENSYFSQGFDELEAGVRGTIYEINLEEDTIYVEDHELFLSDTKTGESYLIPEQKPFSISNFGFYENAVYLLRSSVSAWHEINAELDEKYFQVLTDKVSTKTYSNPVTKKITEIFFPVYRLKIGLEHYEDLKTLEVLYYNMSKGQQIKSSEYLETAFQEVYFAKPGDSVFPRKFLYRKMLLQVPEYSEAQILVRSLYYDIKNIKDTGSITSVDLIDQAKNIDYKKYVPIDQAREYMNILQEFSAKDLTNNIANDIQVIQGTITSEFPTLIKKHSDKLKESTNVIKKDIEENLKTIIKSGL